MPDCGRFTNLELLKKQRYKILFSNNQSRLSNYGILQDIESHHQIWKQENMEAIQKTLGPQVWEALTKLHEEYGDRVGSYHSVVIT